MAIDTNRAVIQHDVHTVKVGRATSLRKATMSPAFARGSTSKRGFVRVGRKSYVEDKFGNRRK